MKKTIKKITAAIMTLFILSGCASVPDEVKEDMSSYRDTNNSTSDSFEFTYIKVSDLAENAETALNKEYGQLMISDKIRFVQPEEIHIMSFETEDDFTQNADAAMKLFFTEQVIEQHLEVSDDNAMFMSDTDRIYCCVADDGFIAMLKPDAYDISFSCQIPNVKIYHPDRNDDLSDEYQLKDGKCSVGDAVEYIENWFEANYKPLAPYYDYSVESVIVREHEGNYLYQITVQALYKGVPLDSYTRERKIVNGKALLEMGYTDYGVQIQMINVNEIDSFTNLVGIYKPTELEKIDECISMESALELCEITFTDFKNITFSDIDIMYTLEPVYEYDDEGNILYIASYDSRPMWEIIIDVPPESFTTKGDINTYGDIRKYIYIDMITGELAYNLDITYR